MKKFWDKYQERLLICLIIVAGFVLRTLLVHKVVVGDIMAYLEWGQKF